MKLRNKMIKALIGGELVFFLVCMLISQGTAQQIGPEFPIATTTGWEMSASAAFDGTNYLVGIEGEDAAGKDNITAQLVSQSGTLVGSRISVGRTGGTPGVAFDGTNYLMVWDDDTLCNTIGDVIYGQLISKSGTLIGSPFPISPETGNNSLSKHFRNMNIIFDGTNYFVVWDHSPTPCQKNGCTDEYGQFVTPSGTLLGGPIKINTTPCGGGGAAAAFDGTNILVTWGSEWNASGTQSVCWTDSSGSHCDIANIWGQFITKSSAGTPGTLSGSNFLISAASVLYSLPSIAFDGTNYMVVFQQETTRPDTCPSSGCKWDIYGQLATKAGAPIGSRITISDTSPNHSFPLPVFNGTNYLVTWTEGFGSTEATVKGRFFDKSGGPVGSEFALFSPSGGRVPWAAFTLFDGSKYFSVINRGTPGIDPYDEDAYTNQDVFGAFIKITINISARCDFNGDGKTDIFWRHTTSGQTAIWIMNGSTITSIGAPGIVSDTNWQVKGIGDFNGDGMADVLWQNSTSGWTAIWFMNGATITSIESPGAVSDSNWKIQGIGDFNGDGKADVLWRHATSGQTAIWLMDGNTISSIGAPGTVSDLNWQIKGIGDFNGDGKADVLWQHATSGQTALWLMNGSTITSIGAPGIVSDLNWQIKGIGDFDGDGKSDILWQHATSGWTVVWFMNGAIVSSSQSPGAVSDTNWEIKSIGDFNGDGKADVLWRHATSGQTAIWLMSGSTVTDVGAPGTVSDLNWQIAN